MLRSGFEPESLARKAEMIGRATLPEQIIKKSSERLLLVLILYPF
jgi:hypothetical protein